MELEQFLKSKVMHALIIFLVVINAVILGLAAMPDLESHYHDILRTLDFVVLVFLSSEILLRIVVFKSHFFRHHWNSFDLTVVSLSVIGYFDSNVLAQGLRVLLIFRIVEFSPTMKMLSTALIRSFRTIFYSIIMMSLVFYAYALSGYYLYHNVAPDGFGSLHQSFLSLFQLMIYDNFGDISGPILDYSLGSWVFLISFLFFTAFSFLNLIMGIVVNAIDHVTKEQENHDVREHRYYVQAELEHMKQHREHVHSELRVLRKFADHMIERDHNETS